MVPRRVSGKTLAETLVAMLIIASVMSLWSVLYLRLSARPSHKDLLCGQSLLQEHKALTISSSLSQNQEVFYHSCNGRTWSITKSLEHDTGLWLITVELDGIKPPISYNAYVPAAQ